jgi:hypothetical protein
MQQTGQVRTDWVENYRAGKIWSPGGKFSKNNKMDRINWHVTHIQINKKMVLLTLIR